MRKQPEIPTRTPGAVTPAAMRAIGTLGDRKAARYFSVLRELQNRSPSWSMRVDSFSAHVPLCCHFNSSDMSYIQFVCSRNARLCKHVSGGCRYTEMGCILKLKIAHDHCVRKHMRESFNARDRCSSRPTLHYRYERATFSLSFTIFRANAVRRYRVVVTEPALGMPRQIFIFATFADSMTISLGFYRDGR